MKNEIILIVIWTLLVAVFSFYQGKRIGKKSINSTNKNINPTGTGVNDREV